MLPQSYCFKKHWIINWKLLVFSGKDFTLWMKGMPRSPACLLQEEVGLSDLGWVLLPLWACFPICNLKTVVPAWPPLPRLQDQNRNPLWFPGSKSIRPGTESSDTCPPHWTPLNLGATPHLVLLCLPCCTSLFVSIELYLVSDVSIAIENLVHT